MNIDVEMMIWCVLSVYNEVDNQWYCFGKVKMC